jgi:hypothetical protein
MKRIASGWQIDNDLRKAYYGRLDVDRARELVGDLEALICSCGQSTPWHVIADFASPLRVGVEVASDVVSQARARFLLNAMKALFAKCEWDAVDDRAYAEMEIEIELLDVHILQRFHDPAAAAAARAVMMIIENFDGTDFVVDGELDHGALFAWLREPKNAAMRRFYFRALSLGIPAVRQRYSTQPAPQALSDWHTASAAELTPLLERAQRALALCEKTVDTSREGRHALICMNAFALAKVTTTPDTVEVALAALDDEALVRPDDARGQLTVAVSRALRLRLLGRIKEAAYELRFLDQELQRLGFERHRDSMPGYDA